MAVNHCLMALPGTKKSDLVRVMSHPQALAQVKEGGETIQGMYLCIHMYCCLGYL